MMPAITTMAILTGWAIIACACACVLIPARLSDPRPPDRPRRGAPSIAQAP